MSGMSLSFRYVLRAAAVVLALGVTQASAQQTPPAVPVYDATQLALGRYTVLKRIPVGDWRTAFWVGGHDDIAAAQNAVLGEAARLGADGVINLVCLDQTDRLWSPAGYYCYANAISLKR